MKKCFSLLGIFLAMMFFSGCSLGSVSTSGVKTTAGVAASSIMKTVDAGKTWEPKNKTDGKVNLGSIDVLSMAINPFDEKNIFAGTLKNGIFQTIDGGENWNALVFPAEKVYGLLIDNTQSRIMYATGVWQEYGKIFKSADSGKEWDEIYTAPSKGPLVISLAMDKSNPNILYAGTSDKQIIKSTDGGSSWQNMFVAAGAVTKIAIDSSNSNLIYALVLGGNILRSADGGKTFINISESKINGAETIETDFSSPRTIYAGGKSGLFKSKDAGDNWEEIKTLSDSNVSPAGAIAVNPANSNEIIYGASQVVYKSVDSGKNWSPIQLETKKTVNVIRYDMNNPNVIYLGLRDK